MNAKRLAALALTACLLSVGGCSTSGSGSGLFGGGGGCGGCCGRGHGGGLFGRKDTPPAPVAPGPYGNTFAGDCPCSYQPTGGGETFHPAVMHGVPGGMPTGQVTGPIMTDGGMPAGAMPMQTMPVTTQGVPPTGMAAPPIVNQGPVVAPKISNVPPAPMGNPPGGMAPMGPMAPGGAIPGGVVPPPHGVIGPAGAFVPAQSQPWVPTMTR